MIKTQIKMSSMSDFNIVSIPYSLYLKHSYWSVVIFVCRYYTIQVKYVLILNMKQIE